ncbi:DUF882 domain-containing protein [Methyloraptor flagellatus]|uniref:DUF882 domain-containing protein n=1 Tax=Methyloraptor flagellatus TaxID=3162530 RepID=UPI00387DC7DD
MGMHPLIQERDRIEIKPAASLGPAVTVKASLTKMDEIGGPGGCVVVWPHSALLHPEHPLAHHSGRLRRKSMRNRLFLASVVAAATFGAAEARAETRSLTLMNTHTQERATVVFKRDGVYDQNGLQELNRLLRDWRRNEATKMDPQLFDLIWEVYRDSGATQPIHIVCGYRSPATNNMLRSRSRGVAKFSQHMLGKAMDFYLPGVDLERLREVGMKKQIGGVGFYPSSNFVHMDTGSVRAWPRMTREQLVRLFPDGKTAHLPADGGPLSGYQVALAESQARKGRTSPTGDSATRSGGGLLAALFGGGSSSSSSAAPGEDEEEVVRTPASRGQELRQGPVAPNKVLLTRNEDAPGVSTGPAAPSARSVRTQAVAPPRSPSRRRSRSRPCSRRSSPARPPRARSWRCRSPPPPRAAPARSFRTTTANRPAGSSARRASRSPPPRRSRLPRRFPKRSPSPSTWPRRAPSRASSRPPASPVSPVPPIPPQRPSPC